MGDSPRQKNARTRYYERNVIRANAIFEIFCEDCGNLFKGTQRQARDRGWRKKWRRRPGKKGIRVQVDVCPECKGGFGERS